MIGGGGDGKLSPFQFGSVLVSIKGRNLIPQAQDVSGLYKRYTKSNAKNMLNQVKGAFSSLVAKIKDAFTLPQLGYAMA